MIRVVVCGEEEQTRLMLRAMIERVAERINVPCFDARQFSSSENLAERLKGMRPGLVDVAVLHMPQGAIDSAHIQKAADDFEGAQIVVVSPNRADAALAYEVGAFFLLDPVDPVDFVRVAKRVIDNVTRRHKDRIVVKSKSGIDSLSFERFLFVETARNGVLVHFSGEQTIALRSSLQALFEALEFDDRFVKAGSSFIVNLDNVRSLGSGSVIFADGEAIIVPVRSRRPVREALDSYHNA